MNAKKTTVVADINVLIQMVATSVYVSLVTKYRLIRKLVKVPYCFFEVCRCFDSFIRL